MTKPDHSTRVAKTHPAIVHGKKLTPEEYFAGKTPNSGKLRKNGTPVPGQTPEADAARAIERANEAAELDDDGTADGMGDDTVSAFQS